MSTAEAWSGGSQRWRSLATMLLPAAIGLLALVLRLHGLGDKPFWFDEVATLHRVTTTVTDLAANSFSSNHYPSYFLILWLGTTAQRH